MRRLPVAGALLAASGVLSLLGYAILGTQFGWPAVLDEPGTAALRARGLAQWFAVLGVALAAVWAVLVPVATAFAQPTLEFGSPNVYTAWYLWLLALGVLLIPAGCGGRSRSDPPPHSAQTGRRACEVSMTGSCSRGLRPAEPQSSIGQRDLRASRYRVTSGLTAVGRPTACSMGRSEWESA